MIGTGGTLMGDTTLQMVEPVDIRTACHHIELAIYLADLRGHRRSCHAKLLGGPGEPTVALPATPRFGPALRR